MFRRHCSSVANYGDAKAESPLSAAGPFILGPGRAPISAKVVTQIVSCKFIDMVKLVPENLEELRPVTPSFSIEGSTIIPSSKTNPRKVKEISDIMTWVEAFTSYISVMSAYFPHRARDLLAYMALVMRTEKRYGGSAWRHYDRAFRRSP